MKSLRLDHGACDESHAARGTGKAGSPSLGSRS